jgi:hypothetical protein
MDERPPIPKELERQLLVEAGHRCAIPTCRQVPVEIAHIVQWSKCQEHKFENMICLCPTCHARYDRGDIDRKSILIYKHNLAILNGRYGDFEQRILMMFAEQPGTDAVKLPGGFDILILYLLRDGLLIDTGKTSGVYIRDLPTEKVFSITEKGRIFISQWLSAREIN